MLKSFLLVLSTTAVLYTGGCGGDGSGSGGSGGTAGSAGMAGSGGATAGTGGIGGGTSSTATTGGTGGSAAPLAPTMISAEPLGGALHVMWENNTPDCEKIELDRKKDDGAYATEYTLTGAATSQHDGEATAPGTYCYVARCIKGADTSPDSNEKCGTP